MKNTKILLLDIETAPSLGYVWGKYDQNVLEFKSDWYILCFAAKWLDKRKMIVSKLPDFKRYKQDREDDYGVVERLWNLFNEADIIVAQNGDRFDIRKCNARFIAHGFPPPEPYQTVDTLKVARKYFKFDSNKLDDLGHYLGVGRKEDVGSFKTWKGCMEGRTKAWRKMVKYNKQDVHLLESVYEKLRPWMTNHPNRSLLEGKEMACPICSSPKVQKRGYSYTRTRKYQRFQCQECGGWSRARLSEKSVIVETK